MGELGEGFDVEWRLRGRQRGELSEDLPGAAHVPADHRDGREPRPGPGCPPGAGRVRIRTQRHDDGSSKFCTLQVLEFGKLQERVMFTICSWLDFLGAGYDEFE